MNMTKTVEMMQVLTEAEVNMVSGAGPFGWLFGKIFPEPPPGYISSWNDPNNKPITGSVDWGSVIRPWKWF